MTWWFSSSMGLGAVTDIAPFEPGRQAGSGLYQEPETELDPLLVLHRSSFAEHAVRFWYSHCFFFPSTLAGVGITRSPCGGMHVRCVGNGQKSTCRDHPARNYLCLAQKSERNRHSFDLQRPSTDRMRSRDAAQNGRAGSLFGKGL